MTILNKFSSILAIKMSVSFILFHKIGSSPASLKLPKGYWHMGTCLRSLVISDYEEVPSALKEYNVYKNEEAFQYLLQIICGLKSPLIGETEVLGQFKNFIKMNKKTFSTNVDSVFKMVLKEAKAIRTEFLQNLGCSSYGSLLRKYIPENNDDLTVLGAGSLTLDILPWFTKRKSQIRVLTRDLKKHEKINLISSNIQLKALNEVQKNAEGILIIAAPLSSEWLKNNFDLSSFSKIFDLRGESAQDPLLLANVYSLGRLFLDIEKNKKQAQEVKQNALAAIKASSLRISHMEKQRPFGWEDLCQYA